MSPSPCGWSSLSPAPGSSACRLSPLASLAALAVPRPGLSVPSFPLRASAVFAPLVRVVSPSALGPFPPSFPPSLPLGLRPARFLRLRSTCMCRPSAGFPVRRAPLFRSFCFSSLPLFHRLPHCIALLFFPLSCPPSCFLYFSSPSSPFPLLSLSLSLPFSRVPSCDSKTFALLSPFPSGVLFLPPFTFIVFHWLPARLLFSPISPCPRTSPRPLAQICSLRPSALFVSFF